MTVAGSEDFATFWQLTCLEAVHRHCDWAAAASSVSASKAVVQKAIARLESKVGEDVTIVHERGDQLVVDDDVAALASNILERYREFASKAAGERDYWLRIDGNWSHAALFLGAALTKFEQAASRRSVQVRTELAHGYGDSRSHGGAGILRRLLAEDLVDAVIARGEEPGETGQSDAVEISDCTLIRHHLYRTLLLAVVHKDHPVLKAVRADDGGRRLLERDVLSVGVLDGASIASSPKGHWSRDFLDIMQTGSLRLRIDTMSIEPSALVALASPRLVPIVTSDSYFDWSVTTRKHRVLALSPAPPSDEQSLLGGNYWLHWRTSGMPETLLELMPELASNCFEASARLRDRVDQWSDFDLV